MIVQSYLLLYQLRKLWYSDIIHVPDVPYTTYDSLLYHVHHYALVHAWGVRCAIYRERNYHEGVGGVFIFTAHPYTIYANYREEDIPVHDDCIYYALPEYEMLLHGRP